MNVRQYYFEFTRGGLAIMIHDDIDDVLTEQDAADCTVQFLEKVFNAGVGAFPRDVVVLHYSLDFTRCRRTFYQDISSTFPGEDVDFMRILLGERLTSCCVLKSDQSFAPLTFETWDTSICDIIRSNLRFRDCIVETLMTNLSLEDKT